MGSVPAGTWEKRCANSAAPTGPWRGGNLSQAAVAHSLASRELQVPYIRPLQSCCFCFSK